MIFYFLCATVVWNKHYCTVSHARMQSVTSSSPHCQDRLCHVSSDVFETSQQSVVMFSDCACQLQTCGERLGAFFSQSQISVHSDVSSFQPEGCATLMTCVSVVGFVSQNAPCVWSPLVNPRIVSVCDVFCSHYVCVLFHPVNCFVIATAVFAVVPCPSLPPLLSTCCRFHHTISYVFCVSSAAAAQDSVTEIVLYLFCPDSQNGRVSSEPSQQQDPQKIATFRVCCLSDDRERQIFSSCSSSSSLLPDCRQFSACFCSYSLCDHRQSYPSFLSLCVSSSCLDTEMNWRNWNLCHRRPCCNVKNNCYNSIAIFDAIIDPLKLHI